LHERLSALDASFLYLEKPSTHMHVAGLGILDPSTRKDGPLTEQDLARLITERIHLVPRFRQKVVIPPFGAGRPVWVDDEGFDLSFHLRRTALPSPGGRRELAEFVQRVHSRPLDRTKPLWEMYLIEGLEDGYVAVLSKSHHAMIDGLGGMDIATVLFDFTEESQRLEPQPWAPRPGPSGRDLFFEAVADQLRNPVHALMEGTGRILRAPQEALAEAGRLLGGVRSLLALGQAPAGPFNVPVGPNRRFAMAEVPVADAKAVKNALGGTVNDVLLAAVAGALRTLLRQRGERVTGQTLRAMVPVSTRGEATAHALGNQVSMFFVDLPIGVSDPARRLRRITGATRELKTSHQAMAATAIMNSAQWAPPTLHGLAARLVARQRFVNLIVSNVPGPQVPLYLDGARLMVAFPVLPLGETMALSVAVTSLSGVLGFGFTTDWDSGADIDTMAEGLLQSFEELKKAAEARSA
jgi:diacylglycerol O-acyltransferase / wax synthase